MSGVPLIPPLSQMQTSNGRGCRYRRERTTSLTKNPVALCKSGTGFAALGPSGQGEDLDGALKIDQATTVVKPDCLRASLPSSSYACSCHPNFSPVRPANPVNTTVVAPVPG